MLEVVDWATILRVNPFIGKRVYFSNSISGGQSDDPEVWWQLEEFIENGGGKLLDKHVTARNKPERELLFEETATEFLSRTGFMREEKVVQHCEFDLLNGVDGGTHFIGGVDVPSHGVRINAYFAFCSA